MPFFYKYALYDLPGLCEHTFTAFLAYYL